MLLEEAMVFYRMGRTIISNYRKSYNKKNISNLPGLEDACEVELLGQWELRPTQRVKRASIIYLNIYGNGVINSYKTREDADNGALKTRVACVAVPFEYEMEE